MYGYTKLHELRRFQRKYIIPIYISLDIHYLMLRLYLMTHVGM